MGFRTVVIVGNDYLSDVKDPLLKEVIDAFWSNRRKQYMKGPYRVVEQVHCDQDSLLHVRHLDAELLATTNWDHPQPELQLLKQAADALGYRLVRKTK